VVSTRRARLAIIKACVDWKQTTTKNPEKCVICGRDAYNSLDTLCMPSGRNNTGRPGAVAKLEAGRPVIINHYTHLALMAGILLDDWGERRSQIDRVR
jgi:hypothetical protein